MNTNQIDNEESKHAAAMSQFAMKFVVTHYSNQADHDAALVALFVRAIEHATLRKVNIQGLFK
tara:strand:+ start:389 stop:577 length:189 start_codon:yes stop_codon:yes gene_type:complete